MEFLIKKILSLTLAVVFFCQNILLAGSDIWSERKKPHRSFQVAALPSAERPLALPSASLGIPDLAVGLALQKGVSVPSWIASAIAPYASIQDIHTQKNSQAKTVLVLQDAHLHTEAQLNIAGTIEALAKATDKKLLVAMEGAVAKKIDVSEYTSLDADILRHTAEGLARVNVLNGAELAAIGYGANVDVVGVETESDYHAHVQAILNSRPLKDQTEKDLAKAQSELTTLKKKVLSPELAHFDASRSAYENGTLALPAYVLYLDSVVSASSINLRNLIAASLLEGSIDFHKVETERAEMIRVLAGKLSTSEITLLTQLSALFRSSEVSYTAYYDHLKMLAEKHGVSFTKYPEMNLYVQYVLKSEAIDHAELFKEIKVLEAHVAQALEGTAQEKEILAQSKRLGLSKKLIDFTLTEEEWAEYSSPSSRNGEARRGLEAFESFYTAADRRNHSISDNLAASLRASNSEYAVLVAGGFHSQTLLKNLNALGFNTILLSPKITKMKEGLSSIDVLASGRLPLDRLFAGEKLFIPTPPATSTHAGLLSNVVRASVEAGGKILRSSLRLASATVGKVTARASRQPKSRGFVVIDGNGGEYGIELEGDFQGAYFGKPFSWVMALSKHLLNASLQRAETLERFVYAMMGILSDDGTYDISGDVIAKGNKIWADRSERKIWFQTLVHRFPEFTQFSQFFENGFPATGRIDTSYILHLEQIIKALVSSVTRPFMSPAAKHALKMEIVKEGASVYEDPLWKGIGQVRQQLGLSKPRLSLQIFRGNGLKRLAQLLEVKGRHVLQISEEFLERFVFNQELVQVVQRNSGMSASEAQDWLLQRYLFHEFSETFFRKTYLRSKEDRDAQFDFHYMLLDNSFGFALPVFESRQDADRFFRTPFVQRLAQLSRRFPHLFNDEALEYLVPFDDPTPSAFLGEPFSAVESTMKALGSDKYGDTIVAAINLILKSLFPALYVSSVGLDPLPSLLAKHPQEKRNWAFQRWKEFPRLRDFFYWLANFHLLSSGPGKNAMLKRMKKAMDVAAATNPAFVPLLLQNILGIREVYEGEVATNARAALKEVVGSFRHFEYDVQIQIFDGLHLDEWGEAVQVDGNKFVVRASVAFLQKHVYPESAIRELERMEKTRTEAIQWLLVNFVVHEILEKVLRKSWQSGEDEAKSIKKLHAVLVEEGFGKKFKFSPLPLRERLWGFVKKYPFLFKQPETMEALRPVTPGDTVTSSSQGFPFDWKKEAKKHLAGKDGVAAVRRMLDIVGQILISGPSTPHARETKVQSKINAQHRHVREQFVETVRKRYPALKKFLELAVDGFTGEIPKPVYDMMDWLDRFHPSLMLLAFRAALGVEPSGYSANQQAFAVSVARMKQRLQMEDISVTGVLLKGHRLENYSQVVYVPGDLEGKTPARYMIETGAHFFHQKLVDPNGIVGRLQTVTGWVSTGRVAAWLLDRHSTHELVEGFFTRPGPNLESHNANRMAVHELLMKNGFDFDLPQVKPEEAEAYFSKPHEVRAAELILAHAALFNERAIQFAQATLGSTGKMAPSARVPRGKKGPGGMAPSGGGNQPPVVSAAGPLMNWRDKAIEVLRAAEANAPILRRALYMIEQIMAQGPPTHNVIVSDLNTDSTRMLSPYPEYRRQWATRAFVHYPFLRPFIDLVRKSCISTLSQPVIDTIYHLAHVRPDLMEVMFRQVLNASPRTLGRIDFEWSYALSEIKRELGLRDEMIEIVNMAGSAGDYMEMRMLPPGHAVRELYKKRLRTPQDQTLFLIEVGGGIHSKRWILRDKAHNDVSKRAGWKDRNAIQLGRHWQHKAGIAHELVEMFFTKPGVTAGEIEANRLAVHKALVDMGIGLEIPQLYGVEAARFFDTPISVHIAELIRKNPQLFNDRAHAFAATIPVVAPVSNGSNGTDKSLAIEEGLRAIADDILSQLRLKNITLRVNIDETNDPKRVDYMQEVKQPENKAKKKKERIYEWWIKRQTINAAMNPQALMLANSQFDGTKEKTRGWLLQNRLAQEILVTLGAKKINNRISKSKAELREVLIAHGFGSVGFTAEDIRTPLLDRIRAVVQDRPDLFDRKMIRRFAKAPTPSGLLAWKLKNPGAFLMELLHRNSVSFGEFHTRVREVLANYDPTTISWKLITAFLNREHLSSLAQFLATKTNPDWGGSWIGGKAKTIMDLVLSALGFVDVSASHPVLQAEQKRVEARFHQLMASVPSAPSDITVRLIDGAVASAEEVVFANVSKKEIVISLAALRHIRTNHGRELMASFFAAAKARQETPNEKIYNVAYFEDLAEAKVLLHEAAHIADVSEALLRDHHMDHSVPTEVSAPEFRAAAFFSEAGMVAKINQVISISAAEAQARLDRQIDTSHGRGYPTPRFDAWYGHKVGPSLLHHIVFERAGLEKLKELLRVQRFEYEGKGFTFDVLSRVLSVLNQIPPASVNKEAREKKFWELIAPFGELSALLGLPLLGPIPEDKFATHLLDQLLLLAGLKPISTSTQIILQQKLQIQLNELVEKLALKKPITLVLLDGSGSSIPQMAFADVERSIVFVTPQELDRLQENSARHLYKADRRLPRSTDTNGTPADLRLPLDYYRNLAIYKWLLHEILHVAGVPENVLLDHYLGPTAPNQNSFDHFKSPHFFTKAGLLEEARQILKAQLRVNDDDTISPLKAKMVESNIKPTDVLADVHYINPDSFEINIQPVQLARSLDDRLEAQIHSDGSVAFKIEFPNGVETSMSIAFDHESFVPVRVEMSTFDNRLDAWVAILYKNRRVSLHHFIWDEETMFGTVALPRSLSRNNFTTISLAGHKRLLAVGTTTGEVIVLNLETKQEMFHLESEQKEPIDHVAISADGSVMAVATPFEISVYRVASKALIWKKNLKGEPKISGLSVSTDGQRLAFVSGHSNEIVTEVKLQALTTEPTNYPPDLEPSLERGPPPADDHVFHGWYANNPMAELLEYLISKTNKFHAFRKFLGSLLEVEKVQKQSLGWSKIAEFLHVSSTKNNSTDPRSIFERLMSQFKGSFDALFNFDQAGENWTQAFSDSEHATIFHKLLELIGVQPDESAEAQAMMEEFSFAAGEINNHLDGLTSFLTQSAHTTPEGLKHFAFVRAVPGAGLGVGNIHYSVREVNQIIDQQTDVLLEGYTELFSPVREDEAVLRQRMRHLAVCKFILHEALHSFGISDNVLLDHYLGRSVPSRRSMIQYKNRGFFTLSGLVEEAQNVLDRMEGKPRLNKPKMFPFPITSVPPLDRPRISSAEGWDRTELPIVYKDRASVRVKFHSKTAARVQEWELPEELSENAMSFAFSALDPNGTIRLAIGHNDGHISIWEFLIREPMTNKERTRAKVQKNSGQERPLPKKKSDPKLILSSLGQGHSAPIMAMFFSRDTGFLASADQNGLSLFWDITKQKVLSAYQHPEAIDRMTMLSRGEIVFLLSASGVYGWRPATGALVFDRPHHPERKVHLMLVMNKPDILGITLVQNEIAEEENWDLYPLVENPIYVVEQHLPDISEPASNSMVVGERFFHLMVHRIWKSFSKEDVSAPSDVHADSLDNAKPKTRRYVIARFFQEIQGIVLDAGKTSAALRADLKKEIKSTGRLLRQVGRILQLSKKGTHRDRLARRARLNLILSKGKAFPKREALINNIVQHVLPLFHGIPAVAAKFQELAGFQKWDKPEFEGLNLDALLQNMLHDNFAANAAPVSIEVISDRNGKLKHDFVFTERVRIGEETHVVLYVTQSHLFNVLDAKTWAGKRDAFQYFLLRTLAHELLGIAYTDLDKIGLEKFRPVDAKPLPTLIDALRHLNPGKDMLAHLKEPFHEEVPTRASSYFGNDSLEILVDKTLGDPANVGTAIADLIAHLKRLPERIHLSYWNAISKQVNPLVRRLEELLSAKNYFKFSNLVRQAVDASAPLFNTSHIVADLILGWAGLDFKDIRDFGRKQQLEKAGQAFFDTYFKRKGWTFQLEIRNGHATYADEDLIFVQKFVDGATTRVVVRATESSLVGVLNQAGKIRQRAAEAGIILSPEDTETLAFQMILAHEIGESLYGLSHESLIQAGIGDGSEMFFSTEGLVGALMALANAANSPYQNKRAEELKAIGLLAPARPILQQIFQKSGQAAQYGARFTGWGPYYNPSGQITPEDLLSINYYEPERKRLEVIPESFAQGTRPSAEVFAEAEVANPNVLMIFDQDGGYKDLADQYAMYLADENRKRQGPFVVAVLEGQNNFRNKVMNYYGYISGNPFAKESNPKISDLDVQRAKKLLDEIVTPTGSFKVLTLTDQMEKELNGAHSPNGVDVTAYVEYLKTEAARANPQIQKVVLISDWRRLVVDATLKAITTVIMNLNLFIKIGDRIKLETVAAIQA